MPTDKLMDWLMCKLADVENFFLLHRHFRDPSAAGSGIGTGLF